ncbi:hypothetical protein [Pontibacter sp. G13]|uniref:hypothetical protein n=1 Tax=Pontibacter sp. G13 TaxID=3074898 RepID=UPI00288B24AE|nr:hypothetical protein [Pontibacter sp. G13]WNJ16955.1 hypothetical protein RJD25_19045 [Pontibacter sp. G13]
MKRLSLFLLVVLVLFVAHTLISTGYFRSIVPTGKGRVVQTWQLAGAEDLTISYEDSFAIISATDRFADTQGGLYFMKLGDTFGDPVLLTGDFDGEFKPHGISMFPLDSARYQVMAVNHTEEGHSIEVFELYGDSLVYIRTIKDKAFIRPNDLVIVSPGMFYVTNDHGYVDGFKKILEEYGGLAVSNAVFYDGQTATEVADGIAYANGVQYDPSRNLLFVASPRAFLVKVYAVQADWTLDFIEDVPCSSGVDNLELAPDGSIWIGSHPNLLQFQAYFGQKSPVAPSEVIRIEYRGTDDYSVQSVWEHAGDQIAASTVAAPWGNKVLIGSVCDSVMVLLDMDRHEPLPDY